MKIEITELFMAKCGKGNKGFDMCFHGTIRRERDIEDNPIIYGKIKVNDGHIYATGKDQWELGNKLDELVILIIKYGLHHNIGQNTTIAEIPFYLS